MIFGYTFAQVRKAWIGFIGFLVTLAATVLAVGPELIPVEALPYINIFIAVAATYGIFRARNAPTTGE